ncbi:MAG: hypothetical protein ACXWBO_13895, partial [Ilumatobacteraceae bacterium]
MTNGGSGAPVGTRPGLGIWPTLARRNVLSSTGDDPAPAAVPLGIDDDPAGLPLPLPVRGTVTVIRGMEIGVRGIRLPIGTSVGVEVGAELLDAEVVAAHNGETRLALLGEPAGLSSG